MYTSCKTMKTDSNDSPIQRIRLQLHARQHDVLPNYKDWLRASDEPLWCSVLELQPCLTLPWAYAAEQIAKGDVWECHEVWLHCAGAPNGHVSFSTICDELEDAINMINADIDSVQYTLLVRPDGMEYDPRRLGGDHQVQCQTGRKRRFTFSVRKGVAQGASILLAIAWGPI